MNDNEPPYARVMGYIADRRIVMIDRQRAGAVQRLGLQPGQRVIDAGCGSGGSFPFVLEQIGPSGEVVGIEISRKQVERAQVHLRERGWRNVRLVHAAAHEAELDGLFDALLLFAAHEILTSGEALDHLFAHLKDGARVVAFGAKRASPPLGWFVNPLFRVISRKWLSKSAPIDPQPWRLLADRVVDLQMEQRWGGAMYLVWGLKKR